MRLHGLGGFSGAFPYARDQCCVNKQEPKHSLLWETAAAVVHASVRLYRLSKEKLAIRAEQLFRHGNAYVIPRHASPSAVPAELYLLGIRGPSGRPGPRPLLTGLRTSRRGRFGRDVLLKSRPEAPQTAGRYSDVNIYSFL